MATKWKIKLDPTDRTWAVARFDKVLGEGEKIPGNGFTLERGPLATQYGLIIEDDAPYAPALTPEEDGIVLWLSVAPEKREDPKFTAGVDLEVIVTIETDATPPNRYQRTWTINTVQQ